MPGMENTAPERMESSSGFLGSPRVLPVSFSRALRWSVDLLLEPVGILPVGGVVDTGLRGDDEALGDRDTDPGHLREVGPLTAQAAVSWRRCPRRNRRRTWWRPSDPLLPSRYSNTAREFRSLAFPGPSILTKPADVGNRATGTALYALGSGPRRAIVVRLDEPTGEKGGCRCPSDTVAKARERRDYERTASIISGALTVVGSSDLAMRGLTAAVKRTAKSAQQQMIADWLKEYTAPGHPGNAFFKNIRHLHPNVRKRFVAGMMANFFMRDPEYTESLLEEKGISSPTVDPHQPLHALQPQVRRLLRGGVRRRGRTHRRRSREHHQPGRSHRFPGVRDAGRRTVRLEAAPRHHRAPSAVRVHGVHQRHHDQRPRWPTGSSSWATSAPPSASRVARKPPTPAGAPAPTTASWRPWTACANAAP